VLEEICLKDKSSIFVYKSIGEFYFCYGNICIMHVVCVSVLNFEYGHGCHEIQLAYL
jgi:hypothetical protein